MAAKRGKDSKKKETKEASTQEALLKVIDEASDWLDMDGVVAVSPGEREGRACIVVGCSRPVSEMAVWIPSSFRGYPVVLEEWGTISAQRPE